MDKETLRKAQLVQLEIAKEIKRVCEENGIQYLEKEATSVFAISWVISVPLKGHHPVFPLWIIQNNIGQEMNVPSIVGG